MAPSHYLRPLLAPDSVALVGASERPGSLGRVVYENMLAGEFKGELYAVNPGHAKVLGRPAYVRARSFACRRDSIRSAAGDARG